MKKIVVKDAQLSQAALEGMDAFLQVVIDALRDAIGGEPTAETMAELNADQMTLLCWDTLHREVMEGGYIQLIHNGYGPFVFKNPFAKALNKLWHMRLLSKLLYEVHTLWLQNRVRRKGTARQAVMRRNDHESIWYVFSERSPTPAPIRAGGADQSAPAAAAGRTAERGHPGPSGHCGLLRHGS